MVDLSGLEKMINYEFSNKFILEKALSHRSYSVEKNLSYDNQRLEFLGDAVIEIILTEYLFVRYQHEDEGRLTKMRSVFAQQEALATLARKIRLGDYLMMGKGEIESGGKERDSTLADTFEALMGAVYLDGGLQVSNNFLIPLIEKEYSEPDELVMELNPKGLLQEFTQKHFSVTPEYQLEKVVGPDHAPSYSVSVSVKGKILARGAAGRRKAAESAAAKTALKTLMDKKALATQKRKTTDVDQKTEADAPN